MPVSTIHLERKDVVHLWFHQQGLAKKRGSVRFSKPQVRDHLERTGALQIDPINVLAQAQYLTLWSRFGVYDRRKLERWLYDDRVAFEYWGHEASLLPISHLPIGRRRMAGFPPQTWKDRSWWSSYSTSPSSKRRVLKRLRDEGPLESSDFQNRQQDGVGTKDTSSGLSLVKEDGRSLKLLWHDGRVAVTTRRQSRIVYDLAERVYPDSDVASKADYEDSWLQRGLRGNGVASERHLVNYITGPSLKAAERKRVIERNCKRGHVVEVRVKGSREPHLAMPEHLDMIGKVQPPEGTNLICPFDSFLWQRKRAEEWLSFRYRNEIYTPPAKREFGYYVLPILHDGKLVGRVDPKLHRDRSQLEIKSIFVEKGFKRNRVFDRALGDALQSLSEFVQADSMRLPRGWTKIA